MVSHLDAWWRRIRDNGRRLGATFDEVGIVHDVDASKRITVWAYANAEQASARLWATQKQFERIDARWRAITTRSEHGHVPA